MKHSDTVRRDLLEIAVKEGVPYHTIQGLVDYIVYGIPPGDFLLAVLENNLMESVLRADAENISAIFNICSFIYNYAPSNCHGSPERVRKYLDGFAVEAKE